MEDSLNKLRKKAEAEEKMTEKEKKNKKFVEGMLNRMNEKKYI